jgi:GTPase SAR1 family protein
MPEEKEKGAEERKDESEGSNDLYIGVNSDLSPFKVDLNALTRGLVVVGQSGCGKSFLLGRVVEELVRNTTEKTRLLVIDSNSDFCEGTALDAEETFKNVLDKYRSGLLVKEFEQFKDKELTIYNQIKAEGKLSSSQLFGRGEKFNLSWKWLVDDHERFLKLVKGDECPDGYVWALYTVIEAIKEEFRYSPEDWVDVCSEIWDIRKQGKTDYKFVKENIGLAVANLSPESGFLEFASDLSSELRTEIWRAKDTDGGLPERLFADSRINFIEAETIQARKARLKAVAFVLMHCLAEQTELVEKFRVARSGTNASALEEARRNLKRTFLLIDEAQNYAPDDTGDPHEKMLGNLIHTLAAEGRKYGLHLILATQRPNKMKRGLLGECDNAIIMKMNSRSDLEHLAKEMRILDVKLLEPCLHFQGQGNAIAVGEMTRMAPYVRLFKSAPRRTVEGGVDIEGF